MPLLAFLLFVVVVIRVIYRKARRRPGGSFGVGPGASGAIYDLLNEDKRKAVELIVEQKTADVDPERARDKNPEPEN